MDLASLYTAAARVDPARPFITYYDDATGERTELSYATCGNWTAKTANLVTDDAGAEPGETAVVWMPPHWLTAAVLLGCWSAGLAIKHRPSPRDATATVAFHTEEPEYQALAETSTALIGAQVYVVNTAPLATSMSAAATETLPNGVTDYLQVVRAQGDDFASPPDIEGDTVALTGLPGDNQLSHNDIITAASARAEEWGLPRGERILLSAERLRPLDWLLVPLAIQGSVVICRNVDTDIAKRAATERARVITP